MICALVQTECMNRGQSPTIASDQHHWALTSTAIIHMT